MLTVGLSSSDVERDVEKVSRPGFSTPPRIEWIFFSKVDTVLRSITRARFPLKSTRRARVGFRSFPARARFSNSKTTERKKCGFSYCWSRAFLVSRRSEAKLSSLERLFANESPGDQSSKRPSRIFRRKSSARTDPRPDPSPASVRGVSSRGQGRGTRRERLRRRKMPRHGFERSKQISRNHSTSVSPMRFSAILLAILAFWLNEPERVDDERNGFPTGLEGKGEVLVADETEPLVVESETESSGLALANQQREKRSLGALVSDSTLEALALERATRAARGRVRGHLGARSKEGIGYGPGRFLSCYLHIARRKKARNRRGRTVGLFASSSTIPAVSRPVPDPFVEAFAFSVSVADSARRRNNFRNVKNRPVKKRER